MADNAPDFISNEDMQSKLQSEEDGAGVPASSEAEPDKQVAQAPDFVPGGDEVTDDEKYGSIGQQALAGAEGVAQGIAGPLAPAAELATGLTTPEDIRGRAEANPVTHALTEVGGFVAGPAKLIKGPLALLDVAPVAPLIARIGSAAVKGAIENSVFQGFDEMAKHVLGDPNQSASTAATDIGLAAILGGAISGSIPGVQSLWKATKGSDLALALKAITHRVGGIENAVPDVINKDIAASGMDIAPTIQGVLSDDPRGAEAFLRLNQSDASGSAKTLQADYTKFRHDAGNAIIESLGKTSDEVGNLQDLSKADVGKQIGNQLAEEYSAQVSPISEVFDKLKNKFKNTPLLHDVQLADGSKAGGTITDAIDKISKLATDEGWVTSPSSDIMREVNRVIKELPLQNTVKNLSDYISQIGANMQANPLNGSMVRAGGMIKSILREAESDALQGAVGKEGGEQAVAEFKSARAQYKAQSDLKEALDERLHAKGSTSGYGKSLKQMASTDGETIINRLSPVNDANIIQVLQKNFPKTADLLKNYHVDTLLKNAASRAKGDLPINSEAVLKTVNNMQPELRQFLVSPEGLNRMQAVGNLLEKFNTLPHNYSNTARTLLSKIGSLPGSAIGLATGIVGHMPIVGAVLGALGHNMSTGIKDAIDYSMLKYLGSARNVSAEGFKSMVDVVEHSIKGEQLLNKASSNVFKIDKDVLPPSAKPSPADLKRLDNNLKQMRQNPSLMLNVGQKVAHYMPDHATALAQLAASATGYINAQRPNDSKQSPLDSEIPPSPKQEHEFNNILSLAEQPYQILDKIKKGTVTVSDITAVKSMYPDLYSRITQKLSQNMTDAVAKGVKIPYATKMGLTLALGQPLDSTLTQPAIAAAMNSSQAAPAAPPMGAEGKKSKGRGASPALGKLPGIYKTPGQEAEADKAQR